MALQIVVLINCKVAVEYILR
uniref:Uncharacterized protein n=1 Tax=Anguilla anguilla TaxID=7936 RepID=A0A0E9U9U8_ANGAN